MDIIIKDLCRRYRMTEDEVKKDLCPEYDINQRGSHKTIDLILCDEVIPIDEKLVNLMKLINYSDINTTQCCQHDLFGWASIQFSLKGYVRFANKLLKKAKEKYNNDMDKIFELDIIQRFRINTDFNNKTHSCKYDIYDGTDEFIFTITMRFRQSEIPILEKNIKDLLDL